MASYVIAFDTANETVAVGVGRLSAADEAALAQATSRAQAACVLSAAELDPVVCLEESARRASNTRLVSLVDGALTQAGVSKRELAGVLVGRGPGSFTGVRICMATAKGAASALEVPLLGVGTIDAVAQAAWAEGVRGRMLVAADAMRKEVYPALFDATDAGVVRLTCDTVVKAASVAEWVARATAALDGEAGEDGEACAGAADAAVGAASGQACASASGSAADGAPASAPAPAAPAPVQVLGDALVKYRELFEPLGDILPERLWSVSGLGLLLAPRAGVAGGDPAALLPVYTRLSDAEENERIRLAQMGAVPAPKDLVSGVQAAGVQAASSGEPAPAGEALGAAAAAEPGESAASVGESAAVPASAAIAYRPLDAAHAPIVATMESVLMGTDAWTTPLVLDELGRRDRSWWTAFDGDQMVGYCGGLVVAGQLQILKIAVNPAYRRRGIAAELIARTGDDARNLGASEITLEVRVSNEGAQAFYERLGLEHVGTRPRYYSDREDAAIMTGQLDEAIVRSRACAAAGRAAAGRVAPAGSEAAAATTAATAVVAGMELQTSAVSHARTLDGRGAASAGEGASAQASPLILAIESSCDETAAAVIDGSGVLHADVVASQIDFHARFGGVVPEIASRKHIEAICGVCDECLAEAAASLGRVNLRWRDLDAVAVTYAPGLVGALVVGVAFAKGAAWGADVPVIAVNHLEGHLYANKIAEPDIAPPMVVSLVSGGHTMLVHVRDWGVYETLGSTIDDAVGEAFDKVAKALGLGYPGGPVISRLAEQGNPKAIDFPRALLHSGDLRFSLSGLKTAVLTYIQKEQAAGRELNLPDIAASFQAAVIDVQVAKARTALEQTGAKEFCLGGGVAANPALRRAYERMCASMGVRLTMPPMSACGDQAAMIAEVALDRFAQGKFADFSLDVKAHAPLDEPY